MDPIHPIAPTPPTLAPVSPAPLAGRVDRDRPRGKDAGDKRRRRPPRSSDDAPVPDRQPGDGDEDSGLHVNVTA